MHFHRTSKTMENIQNKDAALYFEKNISCLEETLRLRKLLLDMGLTETIKWGKPTYMHHGKNVVVIQNFKKYCALLFLNGNLLDDPAGVLVKTGPKTVKGRQIRFDSGIDDEIVRNYVLSAIEASR